MRTHLPRPLLLIPLIGSACILTLAGCDSQKTPEPDSGPVAAPATMGANDAAGVSTPTNMAASPALAAAISPASPPAFAQCTSCHSPEPGTNGIGPSLAGIYGTKAAQVAGYDFSPAMKQSNLTWNEATLDRYLLAPQQVVPGTKMTFPGIKDASKRATVIAYLKSLS